YLLRSTTLGDIRVRVLDLFTRLLKNCKQVVACDNDLCDVALKFLLETCGRGQKAVVFLVNEHKPYQNIDATEVPTMAGMVAKMVEILSDGDKFTACFNTKFQAAQLYVALQAQCVAMGLDPESVQLWTSSHGVPIKNITAQWGSCCPLYSPVIVTGRDFCPALPTVTFCFVCGTGTLSPEEVVQQLARNRNMKALYFHLERVVAATRYFKAEGDVEACMQSERASLRSLEVYRQVADRVLGQDGVELGANTFTRMLCKVELRRHLMKCNFRRHLIKILTSKGFVVAVSHCRPRGLDPAQTQELDLEVLANNELKMAAFIAGLAARAAAGAAAPITDGALEIGALRRARLLRLPPDDPAAFTKFKAQVFDVDGAFQQHINAGRLLLSQDAAKNLFNDHYHGDRSVDAPKTGVAQAAMLHDILKECVDGYASIWELEMSLGREDEGVLVTPREVELWKTLHRGRQTPPKNRRQLLKAFLVEGKKLFGGDFCDSEKERRRGGGGRRRTYVVYTVNTAWQEHHLELFKYSAPHQQDQLDGALAARYGLDVAAADHG
ncbi:hypothetical protein T484DRAFT_1829508, partial [Baffinella frigidus]